MRRVTVLAATVLLFPNHYVLAQGNPSQLETPPWLQKALRMEREAADSNKHDLMILWKDLRTNLDKLREEEVADRLKRIKERLHSDYEILRKVNTRGTASVYSVAMGELVGDRYRRGLLQEAGDLLESKKGPLLLKDGPEALPKPPAHHEIAVVKTLLLYANVIATDEENLTKYVRERGLYNKVQMLYPVTNGKSIPSSVAKVALVTKGKSNLCLQLPNSGFVFAGELVNGQCRGLDTSSFTQLCLPSESKLNSAGFDSLWRSMMYGELGPVTRDFIAVRIGGPPAAGRHRQLER
jgi:hypothetical protein